MIVVHYAGLPCEMTDIIKITKKNKISLIEDSAETLGAKWKNRYTGSFGTGCFSFFPTKNITTTEGGMLTTNSKDHYQKIKKIIAHGIDNKKKPVFWHREAVLAGHNYRLSDLNCALGYSQLKKINQIIQKRKYIANLYNEELKDLKPFVDIPKVSKDLESAWHLYIININFKKLKINRKILIQKLFKNRITTQVHYIPVPMLKFYKTSNVDN